MIYDMTLYIIHYSNQCQQLVYVFFTFAPFQSMPILWSHGRVRCGSIFGVSTLYFVSSLLLACALRA